MAVNMYFKKREEHGGGGYKSGGRCMRYSREQKEDSKVEQGEKVGRHHRSAG